MIRNIMTTVCRRCNMRLKTSTSKLPVLLLDKCALTVQTRSISGTRQLLSSNDDSFESLLREMEVAQLSDKSVTMTMTDDYLEDELDDVMEPPTGHQIRGMIVPTLETHAMLFGDTRYDKLPIAHINATYNNTKCTITDYTGKEKITHSSTGIVGYVNSKKKTAVAALAVGIDAGKSAVKADVSYVRVVIKGLGKGRLDCVKGLAQAGLQVVSLTDGSILDWGSLIPRKARRG